MDEELRKLLSLGYCILPLAKNSKIPLIQNWTNKASSDPATVEAWEKQFPDCNWGVATGSKSGIVVIDIDPRHGGDIQWKRLTINHDVKTATVKTGGGGEHYYFKIPDGVVVNNAVLTTYPGIDVRGDGGQAVIPPSMHESGSRYVWMKAPWKLEPAELPDWLLKIILDAGSAKSIGEKLVPGNRNNDMFHQALMLARQGALQEFTIAALKEWRDQSGAVDFSDHEIEKTVQSAYKRVDHEKRKRNASAMEKTDSDNADRLITLYGDKLRYSPGFGWLMWNDKYWEPDNDDAKVITCATESMKMLRDEALEDARVPENFKAAISRAQWAMTSLNASRLRSMVSLAETREQIRVDSTDLDPRPTKKLLNVNNGTVNLKTGELMPHNPNMYITKMIPIDYDPEAECPFWMRTLELAFDGDKELIDYMQRAIGYSITGSTAEQCLFICWGEQGNNGKSTILETIQRLFGDYAQMSDMKVITSSQMDNRVASSLAKLPGVRLVSMNEAEENQKFSESLIKQITGGDTLQACKKFKEPFEFQPVFKLWIRTNEKPIIRGMNDAIWRRIRLIPFEKPIPAEHRLSRDIVDVRLDKEAEGILNWCIQGAIEWYKNGLQDPDIVTAATQGYRTEMDIIEIFFDECVNDDPNGYVARSELYQTFTRWAKENGLRYIMTSVAFGKRVGRKLNSPPREKIRGQYVWKGISLTEFAQMSFTV